MLYNEVKCKVPECDRVEKTIRGLCHSCYATAHKHVRLGHLTWEMIEEWGLSIPSRAGSRGKAGAFTKAIEDKIQPKA